MIPAGAGVVLGALLLAAWALAAVGKAEPEWRWRWRWLGIANPRWAGTAVVQTRTLISHYWWAGRLMIVLERKR